MRSRQDFITSTGVSKDLEITVQVYGPFLSSTVDTHINSPACKVFENDDEYAGWIKAHPGEDFLSNNSLESNREDTDFIQSMSEFGFQSVVSKFPTIPEQWAEKIKINQQAEEIFQMDIDEQSISIHPSHSQSAEILMNHEQGFKEEHILKDRVTGFIRKFGLKEENMRQTVVRRFKFCMKKISLDLNRYKKLTNAKYLKLIFRVLRLYSIGKEYRDIAENVYLEIRDLIDQFSPSTFKAMYDENSCNHTYVRTLFQDPIMRKLYHLHHLLGSHGLYFKKFKQFADKDLDQKDKQQIIMYCEKFLEVYTSKDE